MLNARRSTYHYVPIGYGSFQDRVGNLVEAGELINVTFVEPNSNSPQLIDAILDVNEGILYLNFSELVGGPAFNPAVLQLHNMSDGMGYSYSLTGGDVPE